MFYGVHEEMGYGITQKLGIALPWSSPFVWTKTMDSLLNLEVPYGVAVKFFRGPGWCPARRHIAAIEKCLDWGADFVCILGVDQVYEPDLLVRLWASVLQGRCPITAMVPSRGYFEQNNGTKPFQPLAWRFVPGANPSEYKSQQLTPEMVEVIQMDGTVQPVHFIGSGCVLFHREHILALKKPWFRELVNPETYERAAVMDTGFMWRLITEASSPAWVDTSIKIRHLHDMEIDDSFQHRFTDWAERGKGDVAIINRLP